MLNHPALIHFVGSFEYQLLVFIEEIEMLYRAFLRGDKRPNIRRILTFFGQQLLQIFIAHGEGTREGFLREHIRCIGLNAWACIASDDGNAGRWRDGHFVAEAFHNAKVSRIGAGATFFRQFDGRGIGSFANMFEHFLVPHFRHDRFKRNHFALQIAVEAHDAKANATFAHGRIFGACHGIRCGVDEVLQHVIKEAHHIFDELRIAFPLIVIFKVQRAEAAHGGAVATQMVMAGWQRNFAAQVRHFYRQLGLFMVLRNGLVHRIDIDDVGLTGFNTGGENFGPQVTRLHRFHHVAVFR